MKADLRDTPLFKKLDVVKNSVEEFTKEVENFLRVNHKKLSYNQVQMIRELLGNFDKTLTGSALMILVTDMCLKDDSLNDNFNKHFNDFEKQKKH